MRWKLALKADINHVLLHHIEVWICHFQVEVKRFNWRSNGPKPRIPKHDGRLYMWLEDDYTGVGHSFLNAGRCFTLLKRCLYSTSNKTKSLAQKASWQIEMKKAIIQSFTLSVNTLNHNVIVSDDPSIFLLLSVWLFSPLLIQSRQLLQQTQNPEGDSFINV